jgi:1,4-alpha-glucan branching enzyme
LPLADDHLARLVELSHDAPHAVLGPHRAADGTLTVRALLPHASEARLLFLGTPVHDIAMTRLHAAGLFVAAVAGVADAAYEIVVVEDGVTRRRRDAYAFDPTVLTIEDAALFASGRHTRLYRKLGAHPATIGSTGGVRFAVWAPHAARVSVVGSFNRWDGRCHPMRRNAACGVWELFIPGVCEGDYYKFEIRAASGSVFLKADPFAFRAEAPPKTASIVHDVNAAYAWQDDCWRERQRGERLAGGFAVYAAGNPMTSQRGGMADMPDAGVAAVAARGYSHIGLAAEKVWGSAGLFVVGEALDLVGLVEACHANTLGVLMPPPPTVLPAGSDDLAFFDGAPLFEAPAEDTAAATAATFAAERGEVQSFLLSQATFWIDRYHCDGWVADAATAPLLRRLRQLDAELCGGTLLVISATPPTLPMRPVDCERLLAGRQNDPFSLLGMHWQESPRALVLRALLPRAEQVHAETSSEPGTLYAAAPTSGDSIVFETAITTPVPAAACAWHVKEPDLAAYRRVDPYAFTEALVTPFDQHLFNSGNHYRIYDRLGAHRRSFAGVDGVGFAVWAPNSEGVSVVGPFNGWDGRSHPMQRLGVSGIWQLFVPGLGEGEFYKFEIRARNGETYIKADPYAFRTEEPPATASIVYEPQHRYDWRDAAWMERRRSGNPWRQPIAIYEVHLASWRRAADGKHVSYRELAQTLIAYVRDMGFTHIELLPIAEHPFEPSWGYQVTSYYAPTARFGRPDDLMYLIDCCHQQGIGVILDWVPGHFPKDSFALAWFDGTHLYEHADPRQGEHRDWGTLIFNYGRHEVENFLIANALFWLEHYHFDGLRVDAVASMLYLDYSRPNPGDWIPNSYGGRENLEAIEFIKHTNTVVREHFPGVMLIAEESTSWPQVSRPTNDGGLGFGFKWNMGWMHDTLAYISRPPDERKHHHGKLTFSLVYAFNENFILSLSHDEVVHMKGSLYGKMPGSHWERMANLRLLFLYMYAHPGKKLLFMGAEFAQRREWQHAGQLDWELLGKEEHSRLQRFVVSLNRLYRAEPTLFEADFYAAGFEWLEVDNAEESIIAFVRKARDPRQGLMFIFNFSAVSRPQHRVGVPYPVAHEVIFDSNDRYYGGAGVSRRGQRFDAEDFGATGHPCSLVLPLAALSGLVLRPAPAQLPAGYASTIDDGGIPV